MSAITATLKAYPDFPSRFRGSLIRPSDAAYPQARRIFNMQHEHDTPGLIARPVDVEDVVCAMQYASAKGVPVAIRSGGHSSDGSSMPDAALVLDMTAMKRLTVDAHSGICRAESGVLLAQLDEGTQEYGLVVPAGTVSTTGVAGLTLGGGVGFNMRRFGATVDNLLACDVVTADGRRVRATQQENPDLLWALAGGGGNFGVVTAFEFRTHAVGPQVSSGAIIFPAAQAADLLANFREHMSRAPRELTVVAALTDCPPFPPVPVAAHGKPAVMLIVVHTGSPEKAPGLIDGLCGLGKPLAAFVRPTTWVETNRMLDAVAPYGRRMQSRGGYLAKLTDGVISAVVKNLLDAPPPTTRPLTSTVQNLWFMGGAITEDFAEDSVAFSREGAGWFWESVGQWDGAQHDAAFTAWADRSMADLKQELRANGYVNLTNDLGAEWLKGLYGSRRKYDRLIEQKKKWDPQNLLRFNKNFKPDSQTPH